jgi:hypothetical protein
MHPQCSKFAIPESCARYKSEMAVETKLENMCSDMNRMYLLTVQLSKCKMGCCTIVNHVTVLLLVIFWNCITR